MIGLSNSTGRDIRALPTINGRMNAPHISRKDSGASSQTKWNLGKSSNEINVQHVTVAGARSHAGDDGLVARYEGEKPTHGDQ